MAFDLLHFNPGQQNEAAFLANFIARQRELDYFRNHLRATEAGQAARHHLMLGPRGFGKTTLLRRLAIALRQEDEFSSRFIGLSFREEQHNVISLDVFWRNCIQSLQETREDEGADETELDRLERLWQEMVPRANLKRSEQDGAPMWQAFAAACHALGRRPVLLIDNLDILLGGLEQHQWGLRAILQQEDGPVMVAAASHYPSEIADQHGAFFDFFRILNLATLSNTEVLSCLHTLARLRGERGQVVQTILERDPGRVAALNQLAGGNPRTLGVLYSVLESQLNDDILAQLTAMLDRFTGWYQLRTEEIPRQSRAVFDALALNWNPMTAAQLSSATGLDTPSVNSHLNRLEKEGHVETVALSQRKKGRNGYQVSERFFNIWYLMRNGPRRTRQTVRFLTEFLQTCYSGPELAELAKQRLEAEGKRPESLLAYAAALPRRSILRKSLITRASVLLSDADPDTHAFISEMRMSKLDLAVYTKCKEAVVAVDQEEYERAEQLLREAIKIHKPNAGLWLAIGIIGTYRNRYDEAEAAFRQAIALDGKLDTPWIYLGAVLADHGARYDEAEAAYCKAIELNKTSASSWGSFGSLLANHLSRYEEAEVAYRKAIDLDAKVGLTWHSLGDLLTNLTRYDEAEAAYRKAIMLDEKVIFPWNNLGNLLADHLGRYDEAEAAYLKAIALDETHAGPWNNLGNLLANHLDRYDEAETAYRKAIELDQKDARLWHNLGHLLANHLDRYDEAETAYRKAIELDQKDARLWYNLGNLLVDHLALYDEAATAFRNAIACDEKQIDPWINLGHLLANHLARYDEAETAYRNAIALDERDCLAWNNLGSLLAEHFGRYDEAAAAYRQAFALAIQPYSEDWLWYRYWFGRLQQDYLGETEAALATYLDGPEDPWADVEQVFTHALHRHDVILARSIFDARCQSLPDAAKALAQAAFNLPTPNHIANGWALLHQAISSDDTELWLEGLYMLQRLLAYATTNGHAPFLLEQMRTHDYPMRYAPLYHATLALSEGEDYLLTINPETRDMAHKIWWKASHMMIVFEREKKQRERG